MKKGIALLATLALIATGYALFFGNTSISVTVDKVSRGDISVYLEISAEALPSKTYTIAHPSGGRVEKVNFKEGDAVSKGDTIMELEKLPEIVPDVLETSSKLAEQQKETKKAVEATEKANLDNILNIAQNSSLDLEALSVYVNKLNDVSKASKELETSASVSLSSQPPKLEQDNKLKSELSGSVVALACNPGEILAPGTPAAIVADMSSMRLVAQVNELDARKLEKGMKCFFDGKTGVIERIGNIATGTVLYGTDKTVKVEIQSEDGVSAFYGGKVEVSAEMTSKENVLCVPLDALQNDSVYVVTKDNIAKKRSVKIGIVDELKAEVLSGLEEGEQVIINPKVTDGERVSIDRA